MAWKRPHVALLLAGGSGVGGSTILNRGVRRTAEVTAWTDELSELEMIADVETILVTPDGGVVGPREWEDIAKSIHTHYSQVDGFVILHEPETAPLTAIAIEAMVRQSGKPIIITPGRVGGGVGGRSNLISALQTATADVSDVLYVSGSTISLAATLQANDTTPGISGVPVGKIDFGIRLFKHRPRKPQLRCLVCTTLETNVAIVPLMPGGLVAHDVPSAAGYVITGFPLQTLTPQTLQPILTTFPKSRPVVVCGSQPAMRWPANWLAVPQMSAPTAAVRLMAALGDAPKLWRTFFRRWAEGTTP